MPGTLQPYRARLRALLPRGRPLPDGVWQRRHRGILTLLWLTAPALLALAVGAGKGLGHCLAEAGVVAGLAAAASAPSLGRRARSAAASAALMTAAALLVHIWDGRIEGHFAFFVALSVLVLYHDWLPYLVALAYVVVHHGVLGVLAPDSVFDHAGAQQRPVTWALIHAGFVLANCAANLVSWRATEELLDSRHEAVTDELTGLSNRRGFTLDADAELRAADGTLALMVLDLDGFKALNDAFGHEAGDAVLREVAVRLRETLPDATLGRLGGDEFVALLRADAGRATAAGRRVVEAVRGLDVAGVVVGVSVGIALAPDHARDRAALLRHADAAMYHAKRQREGVAVFSADVATAGEAPDVAWRLAPAATPNDERPPRRTAAHRR